MPIPQLVTMVRIMLIDLGMSCMTPFPKIKAHGHREGISPFRNISIWLLEEREMDAGSPKGTCVLCGPFYANPNNTFRGGGSYYDTFYR